MIALVEPQPELPLARVAQANLAVVFVPPRNRVGVQRREGPGEGPADGHRLAKYELRAPLPDLREPRDASYGCEVALAALLRAALHQLRHRAAGHGPLHRPYETPSPRPLAVLGAVNQGRHFIVLRLR